MLQRKYVSAEEYLAKAVSILTGAPDSRHESGTRRAESALPKPRRNAGPHSGRKAAAAKKGKKKPSVKKPAAKKTVTTVTATSVVE